jgi:hypothetical protein
LGVSEAFLLLLKDINIDDSVYAVVPYQQPQSMLWCLISNLSLSSKMKFKPISAFKIMAELMLILRD